LANAKFVIETSHHSTRKPPFRNNLQTHSSFSYDAELSPVFPVRLYMGVELDLSLQGNKKQILLESMIPALAQSIEKVFTFHGNRTFIAIFVTVFY
jgi:hypothetical protein